MKHFYLYLFSILFGLLLYCWSRRKLYKFSTQVQGPPTLPIVGNGLKFLCKKEDVLNVFIESLNPYPSPTRMWFGPRLVLFVKDPNQLQIILQSSKLATKAFFYKFLEPFLGQGLFTASGPKYKTDKKILQPLFSLKMLTNYCAVFQKHADKLVEGMAKHVDGPEFDVLDHLNFTAFESSMDLLLEDKNKHSIDYKDIPQYVRRFYHIFFNRITKFWLHFDFIFKRSSYYQEQRKMKAIANTMIEEIMYSTVPQVIQKLMEGGNISKKNSSMLEKLAELVVENPKDLTIENCVDHLMTFMATSQDSQSSAVAFTCMMLGAYPHIQDKVVEELSEVLSNKTCVTLDELSKLNYLDMCLKESMRLFPVAPFIFRDTTEEFQLENLTIPGNVTLALSIYHAHRDRNFWEKPDDFYPEHFAPEAVKNRHPFAFLPFSAGPRKCIAQQYSTTYMKIQLCTILQNYEIQCQYNTKNIKLTTDISVRPVQGYMLKIRKRRV
ncbi:cytochrome P450 4g15 isoform X1 [Tribolium castaneum]